MRRFYNKKEKKKPVRLSLVKNDILRVQLWKVPEKAIHSLKQKLGIYTKKKTFDVSTNDYKTITQWARNTFEMDDIPPEIWRYTKQTPF